MLIRLKDFDSAGVYDDAPSVFSFETDVCVEANREYRKKGVSGLTLVVPCSLVTMDY